MGNLVVVVVEEEGGERWATELNSTQLIHVDCERILRDLGVEGGIGLDRQAGGAPRRCTPARTNGGKIAGQVRSPFACGARYPFPRHTVPHHSPLYPPVSASILGHAFGS